MVLSIHSLEGNTLENNVKMNILDLLVLNTSYHDLIPGKIGYYYVLLYSPIVITWVNIEQYFD